MGWCVGSLGCIVFGIVLVLFNHGHYLDDDWEESARVAMWCGIGWALIISGTAFMLVVLAYRALP